MRLPDFESDGVQLYLGDNLPILHRMVEIGYSYDLLLTDPPFGIGNFVQTSGNVRGDAVKWNESPPSQEQIGLAVEATGNQIIWGANYMNCFPDIGGAIVWVKNQPMPNFSKADIASCSFHKRVELYEQTWTNYVNTKSTNHPAERPVALYKWCIEKYTMPTDSILDPFMGSGTTGVACVQTGRKFIGIEIDPGYFEIAKRRIQEAQLQTRMEI